ncbi:hypothetical protein F5X68DRAFT_242403 [Plectosphaerella plurivora]|uniref:Uncharacterized protein n=1 Tax=Plectosphaerella plurivora TaxID=936078 RepID=A0A9P9A8I1_9PEZI|nr:hypothetical protein F5X68DRAFT_242403 [Plectosphaerella plurivora]
MLNRGGPISKLVGGSLGLASEYKADSRQRKAAAEARQHQASLSQPGSWQHQGHGRQYDFSRYDDDLTDEDEILDLDEAQQTLNGAVPKAKFDMERFIQQHPPSPGGTAGLSSYVLLPQRRPKSQHKGFVRAYAPELQQCDIDQSTWLELLDGCEQSINKNSWFHVMNASVFFTGKAAMLATGVSPALHMASMAIHASVEASRRGYLNHQQNKYLDSMNEVFFKPRGLYCMVVKYEPSSNDMVQNVDLEGQIHESIVTRQEQSKWKSPFSNSSMKLEGDMEMPPPAFLVFPELDHADQEPTSNWIKNFGRVMDSYKDRRAAAKFEAEDPHPQMPAAPRQEFASVYGDPNSAVNKGGFISLASKGMKSSLGPSGGLADKLAERRTARKTRREKKKSGRPLHKLMKADMLYLMVTNLPSQEVLDAVVERSI